MLGNKKRAMFDNIDTVVAAGADIKGEFKSNGSVRVDGGIDGQLEIKRDLILGDQGVIKGSINVYNILVAGTVEGNITAQGKIEITSTGTILGDVVAATFVVAEGGKFQGNCKMIEAKQERKVRLPEHKQ
jgi:cytoskeletal protein CcmA (bactofilin family)